ncbi:DUF4184 family protein [Flavobacterium oreochromis]|uniref:DUF4184 family protein n=1 Tax=Flavobacterium oreochromis TaxID=2906078 RepID=A0ABW8P9K2_9FLAO|nr:DUF4184 family protein [Flavobacterium oreochromis]OWP78393.1 hypothetical protein BWG23_02695 [Flavobacterium oreochromis]
MPFTFSHPAIVLPLPFFQKKQFSTTGLIIGSMLPDFEYFLRMKIKSTYSHTLEGIFLFDLPLGILLTFIFHNIVRNSLLDNLPAILKSRLSIFIFFNWNKYFKTNIIIVLSSILIGITSHIFWDSFTHQQGYFVKIIPFLTSTIKLLGKKIYIFKILQHLSSITGTLFIFFTLYKLPKNKIKTKNISLKYWAIFITIILVITLTRIVYGMNIKEYGNLIVTNIAALLISLIITPLIINKNNYFFKKLFILFIQPILIFYTI